MLKPNIRSQLLIPLTFSFIIITGSFVYSSYWMRMVHYEKGLHKQYVQIQHVLESLAADRTRFMSSAIEFIAEQKQFQNAIQAKDRQALFALGSPLLKRLFSNQQITHFYFYDKHGAIVLRVYHPDDTRPATPRFTMRQAMAQGKMVSGLELGRSGTFTLRVVYPWKVDGKLIGYIELGQEYEHILKELKTVTLTDFAIVLDKKNLDRTAWETGMKMLGHAADWDLLPDRVLVDQTMALPPGSIPSLLAADENSRRYGKRFEIKERKYRVGTFPLHDARERTVGEFVTLLDTTANLSIIRSFITKVVVFSLLVCGGLFFYSYRLLGRVDQRLHANQEQINQHLEISRRELEEACKNLQSQQATILQQDRMACIGQLAASVAHDINNPIGFVYGNLEVLKGYWGKLATFLAEQDLLLSSSLNPEQLQHTTERRQALKIDYVLNEFNAVIDESLEGAERVNRIVLNLKGFSRLDEKEARLTDIHECLESTLNIVRNELRYKADVKKEYGEIPRLVCYPQQLNQVFMNLLINASQAIEKWGEITIRTWADQKHIFISIGDTGCGIPEQNLQNLFEPFFTTKETGVGTGLGLSIAQEIIKKHHGQITVTSQTGVGTVFTLRLPLERDPQGENSHA